MNVPKITKVLLSIMSNSCKNTAGCVERG